MSQIKNFLLAFDHAKNELIHCEEFNENVGLATRAYSDLEAEYRDRSSVDIVLVGSDSLDTVRVTHSIYFKDGAINLINDILRPVARY